MSDDFPTSILTSKPPQQAALILPDALNALTRLNKDLSDWFVEYAAAAQTHNQHLRKLLERGSHFFTVDDFTGSYSNFPRYWNSVLAAVLAEVKGLSAVESTIKNDILLPLRDGIEDVRLSELMINSQELKDVSDRLATGDSSAEIDWNYKAPSSFSSLELYKSHEIQLLFNSVFSFLQTHHEALARETAANEESTKYMLSNFKLPDELNFYLEYVKRAELKPATNDLFYNKQVKQQQRQLQNTTASRKRMSVLKSDSSSIGSGKTEKDKKPSKLKSRVGSIFGRKKKAERPALGETIAEDEVSLASRPTQLSRNTSVRTRESRVRESRTRESVSDSREHFGESRENISVSRENFRESRKEPLKTPTKDTFPAPNFYTKPADVNNGTANGVLVPKVASAENHAAVDNPSTSAAPSTAPVSGGSVSSSAGPFASAHSGAAASTSAPGYSAGTVATPGTSVSSVPAPAASSRFIDDSPNIVKYDSDSSDSDDEPVGNRLSMLQQHDLGPKTEKSDFEPIEVPKPAVPEKAQLSHPANSYEPIESSADRASFPAAVTDKQPPRPPPSRKVVHNDEKARINSQIFHNIPQARDSVFVDHEGGRSASYSAIAGIPEEKEASSTAPSHSALHSAHSNSHSASLSQQNTGNLMKSHDFFKHFVGTTDSSVSGLNSSVSEVINASFKDGTLVKSQIVGEVAFNYNPHGGAPESSLLVNVPNRFDKVIVNPTFVEADPENPSNYRLSTAQITSTTLGGLKYLVKLSAEQVPVSIVHVWKHEPHQSSLLLSLKLNPAFKLVSLNNLVVSAALAPDVTTTSALSKPVGSFNIEANRVTWRYSSALVLDEANPEEKIIARFMTQGLGSEHEAGLQLKFQINDPAIHFASVQDTDGRELPVTRHLTSGNYSAVEAKS